jgi:hypothetical protein
MKQHFTLFLFCMAVFSTFLFAAPKSAHACPDCSCVMIHHNITRIKNVLLDHMSTRSYISAEFDLQEDFLQNNMFKQKLLPAWMMMAEQLTTTTMQNAFAVGSFFDAKQQLDTQRSWQKRSAEAHKDYQPSLALCRFGTNVKSLADTQSRGEFTSFVLSQRSQDRQLGNVHSSAARGNADDRRMRIQQFKDTYCKFTDNNDGLRDLCVTENESETFGTTPTRAAAMQNLDINFGEAVGKKATLNVDFLEDTQASDDEKTIFALANYLFANDVMYRIPESALRDPDNQDELLDMRSILAKRSVAEHSYNTIVGLKTQSSTGSAAYTAPYLRAVLKELGVTDEAQLNSIIGQRPSYDAQMDVLTKRLYQQPTFYTNLYDKPANVTRQGVAMQAIGLMQNFDTWESYLRTEAMLSVMLEMELMRRQEEIQNRLDRL